MKRIIIALVLLIACINMSFCIYPVAIIHGITQQCIWMKREEDIIRSGITRMTGEEVHVECIESGIDSLLTTILDQSKQTCYLLQNNRHFQGDFSIVAISQGTLIARYIIEKCEIKGTVKRFISIGGPLLGTGRFPWCLEGAVCHFLNKFAGIFAYYKLVQETIGPAGFYRDPRMHKKYLERSLFLPDLNNELSVKNQAYYDRFVKLEKLILIKFSKDEIVYPSASSWFEFLDENENVIPLKESDFYKQDYIGVARLMNENKVSFLEINAPHCLYTDQQIKSMVVPQLIY